MSPIAGDQEHVLTDLPTTSELGMAAGKPEVVIRQARRRKRRRRAFSVVALVAAAGLIAGLLATSGSAPPPKSPRTTPSSQPATTKTTTGPTTPSGEPATLSSSAEIRLLDSSASPLMGIVGVAPRGPGSGISALYVTHNFVTYTDISLPVIPETVRAPLTTVSDVSFLTATVGWVVTAALGSGVYLSRTTDGGLHWQLKREIRANTSEGFVWLQFVTATVGWVATGDIGGNRLPWTLLHTVDGGRTWVTLSGRVSTGELSSMSFVNSTLGFMQGTPGPGGGSTHLLMTTDGGKVWSPVAIPVAPSLSGTVFPALPRLFGENGVLPIVVTPQPTELTSAQQVPVAITFDTTDDEGKTWRAGPTLRARAVTGFSTVRSTVGSIAAGPAAAAATPTDWWVLSPKRTGKITVRVTDDAGSTWRTKAGKGLPILHVASLLDHQVNTPLILQAITPKVAFLLVQTSLQGWSSYVTTDGGVRWSLLTPATVTTLPSTRELRTATVHVSPSRDLVNGETVSVSVSGFGANGRFHISECASDVDVSEAGCGIGLTRQPTVSTNGSGKGRIQFVVSASAALSADALKTKVPCANRCVLVVSGGLGHGLVFVPLTFRH
ncbi:MAG: neocarzinostatin apoprotein domain-containing protein [Actinomycetota bacterium]|nr:neocarzinostatin apoprotein domain-containing protein [Actinomycetota bacterium]